MHLFFSAWKFSCDKHSPVLTGKRGGRKNKHRAATALHCLNMFVYLFFNKEKKMNLFNILCNRVVVGSKIIFFSCSGN